LSGLPVELQEFPVKIFHVTAIGALLVVAVFFIDHKVSDTAAVGAESGGLLQRF
jgi:hypothetical protein